MWALLAKLLAAKKMKDQISGNELGSTVDLMQGEGLQTKNEENKKPSFWDNLSELRQSNAANGLTPVIEQPEMDTSFAGQGQPSYPLQNQFLQNQLLQQELAKKRNKMLFGNWAGRL